MAEIHDCNDSNSGFVVHHIEGCVVHYMQVVAKILRIPGSFQIAIFGELLLILVALSIRYLFPFGESRKEWYHMHRCSLIPWVGAVSLLSVCLPCFPNTSVDLGSLVSWRVPF
jgi:hypothetical protein